MNNDIFLATTTIQDFWDKDSDKIVFLGSWCMLYDERNNWRNLNYEILDSPWKKKEDTICELEYCYKTYKILIERLSETLNHLHKVNYETRYWKIIVGPWFATFLYLFYDHYIYVKHALKQYPYLRTICLSKDSFVTPWNYDHFYSLAEGDFYNLQIFSQIFNFLGRSFPSKKLMPPKSTDSIIVGWKQNLGNTLKHIQKIIAPRFPILLWDIYLSNYSLHAHKISFATLFRAILINYKNGFNEKRSISLNKSLRTDLAKIQSDDSFQDVLIKSLPVHFPIVYLEKFSSSLEQICATWNKKLPKTIMSATGWYGNEYMKFVAAENTRHGGKLIGYQHGGGYGTAMHPFLAEKLETDICDIYYTWGWGNDSKKSNLRDLPNPSLSASKQKKFYKKTISSILFVSVGAFRYGVRSIGYDIYLKTFLESQTNFFAKIPNYMHKDFILRFYPHEYGLSQDKRILHQYPTLKIDSHKKNFMEMLGKSCLVVFDNLGTTFLEALHCNVPLIVFNGYTFDNYREEVRYYIDKLKEAGIYFENAEDAAEKVKKIYPKPELWWNRKDVQLARICFMNKYSLASKDWLKQWRNELSIFSK